MGFLPKLLFALMLVLPGGFVVGPAMLLLKRWHDRRSMSQNQQPQQAKPVIVAPALAAEHPVEHRAAA